MTRTALAAAGVLLLALGSPAVAQTLDTLDPLHGFCWGTTPACTDQTYLGNGHTPTFAATPDFGFALSPANASLTGDYMIALLIPNNADPNPTFFTGANALTITGSSPAIPTTNASLFTPSGDTPPVEWTSGNLEDFLGNVPRDSGSNNMPIGAYNDSTEQALNPGAGGFYVYEADLGTQTVSPLSDSTPLPELETNASLPIGSYIVGFLSQQVTKKGVTSTDWIDTVNSGAILEAGNNGPPIICIPGVNCNQQTVPEPSDLSLLAVGLIGLGVLARRRRSRG